MLKNIIFFTLTYVLMEITEKVLNEGKFNFFSPEKASKNSRITLGTLIGICS